MNIVVEGPDNSGKSTLINFIAPRLGMRVERSIGPPVSSAEWRDRAAQCLAMDNVIFDRHPMISEPVYGVACRRGMDFSREFPGMRAGFYGRRNHFFFYCVGQGFDGHVPDHVRDTPSHLIAVRDRYSMICKAYDCWAKQHANVIYRIGDDMGLIGRLCEIAARKPLERKYCDHGKKIDDDCKQCDASPNDPYGGNPNFMGRFTRVV